MTAEQLEELLGRLQDECDTGAIHDLYVAAPSLARRVIAAEKLVTAYDEYHRIHPLRVGKVENAVKKALTAYREASK